MRNERLIEIPGLAGTKIPRLCYGVGEKKGPSHMPRIYTRMFPETDEGLQSAEDLVSKVGNSIGKRVEVVTLSAGTLHELQQPPFDAEANTPRNTRFITDIHQH